MKRLITIFITLLSISTLVSGQDAMMMSSNGGIEGSGEIIHFMDIDDAKMHAHNNPTVLFFYADWCPTCRAELKKIESGQSILKNITVIIVNYDKSKELKRKYGVTYQHTYVQIDRDGESIALWNRGGPEAILGHVVRMEMN